VKRVHPIQPSFGIRIKKLRFDANMGQQELADLCELSLDQISNIERGKSFAGEMTIALLARAFGIPHSALFDYSENQDFVKNGGTKWRAARKAVIPPVRNHKSVTTIRSSR
jgi:transcriptional regulator with XRE-family HTH domain